MKAPRSRVPTTAAPRPERQALWRRTIGVAARHLLERFFFRRARHRDLDLRIYYRWADASAGETGDAEGRVDFTPDLMAALDLIAAHDPRTAEQLPKLLTGGIWVRHDIGDLAHFDPQRHRCNVSGDHFEAPYSVVELATTLIHEATHARLFRAGIPYDAHLRFRIEKVCIRRELAFAHHLPYADDVVPEIVARLDALDPDYYSDAAFEARRIAHRRAHILALAHRLRALRRDGLPRDLIRWVLRRLR